MTFLNPFVLFGLAAAAIPILIHLLSLRKLRTIDFSSLRFLKELQKSSLRRLRIRQLLLLILRVLTIIALVLAFSRPILRGTLAGIAGGKAASTIVILLDDSPSMSIRTPQGVQFSQAKEAASQILGVAEDGDNITLLPLSHLVTEPGPPAPAGAVVQAREQLRQAELSTISVPLHQALITARTILAQSPNANAELYLLTDGQATQFPVARNEQDSVLQQDERTRLFLVSTPSVVEENLSVGSLNVTTQIVIPNKPVTVKTVLRNSGQTSQQNSLASIYLDGTRVVQQSTDIPAGGSATYQWTMIPKRRGILSGYVQLEDDPLEIDNRYFFSLHVPEDIRVLLCSPTMEGMRFPLLALTLAGDTSYAGLFSVQKETEEHLPSVDLNKTDVIVFCGLKDFSPPDADRIIQVVRSGRSLLLFPGRESNLRSYNETLLRGLGIPQASLIQSGSAGGGEQGEGTESNLSFGTVDFAHPIFSGMFALPAGKKDVSPSIESPRVLTTFAPTPGGGGHTIIALSNGTPFLSEYRVGEGRVLVFAVEAGLTWSDFPVKGLFAPLLHRTVMYAASHHEAGPQVTVGQPIQITTRLRNVDSRDVYLLRSPSGTEERVIPLFLPTPGTARFTSGPTIEVGTYTLIRTSIATAPGTGSGGQVLQAVPVNCPPAESDLRSIRDDERTAFFRQEGFRPSAVRMLSTAEPIADSIREARYGIELWKYLVGIAICLALLEMVVGREPKPEPPQLEL